MNADFSFEIDPSQGLVRITMAGLFTVADVRAFAEARRKAHKALGWPKNAHVTLNDLRDMKIQPQETVTAFYEMLADPDYRSRRLAFVAAPTLVRGQLQRALAGRDDARCFEDKAEAEAWLFEEEPAALPLRRAARA
jgi:hypothetical protein